MDSLKGLKRNDEEKIEKEDYGKFIVYSLGNKQGMPAAIFYKIEPSTEALTLMEVSNSSRISPKEGETLLERVKRKSEDMLSNYGEEAREKLENIIYALGSNNIKEQAHVLIALVAPIYTIMKVQEETLGFASQERSTRYVVFKEYYVPKSIEQSNEAKELYISAIEKLQNAYGKLSEMLKTELEEEYKAKNGHAPTQEELKQVIIPTARDLIRGFVPLAAQSIVYISANAKNVENIEKRLLSTGSNTDAIAGTLIAKAFSENLPALSRHMEPSSFSKALYSITWDFKSIDEIGNEIKPFSALKASISESSSTEEQIKSCISDMGISEEMLEKMLSSRSGKFDALNRTPFGIGSILANFETSLGSMRDLMRHRDSIKRFSIGYGFVLPDELMQGAKYEIAKDALEYALGAMKKLSSMGFSEEALLIMPLATGCKLSMEMGLGEAIYIAENRSTKEAQPEYKHLSIEFFEDLKKRYPELIGKRSFFVGEAYAKYSRVEKEGAEKANKVLE